MISLYVYPHTYNRIYNYTYIHQVQQRHGAAAVRREPEHGHPLHNT